MADLGELIRAVDELDISDLKQLYDNIIETHGQALNAPIRTPSTPRILGLFEHVGETWTSDDYADPQCHNLDTYSKSSS